MGKLFKYGVFTKSRVEAFSDGVFAIIVTLLILEIKVPHIEHADSAGQLLRSIMLLMPKFVSWVISFLTLCIVWMNHHRLFEMFKGINIGLFWMNVNMLLWVCFVPFPTALLGDYPHNPLAVAFYGLVMAVTGTAFVAARLYGLKHRSLLKENISLKRYRKGILFAFLFGPVSYTIAAAMAWVHTYISLALYFLIAIYFVFSFPAKEENL
ncbi:MAG TPA: TMEM175 family protein [Candidatus Omnitrophota bacterium]|nr:TMEM175 family protein [Candidatus Omnitrophota bacterium]